MDCGGRWGMTTNGMALISPVGTAWDNIDWDEIDLQSGLFLTGDGAPRPQPQTNRPCPYCGTLNPPDAEEATKEER